MWSFFEKFRKKEKKQKIVEYENLTEDYGISPDYTKHHVVDLCEQIIEASRELEDARGEYSMVTSYLNDIEIVEALPKEKIQLLTEYANYIVKLNTERDELLNKESKLSAAMFSQIEAIEDEIPQIVKRLKENEEYLAAIEHDLRVLKDEKENWIENKEDCQEEQKSLRKLAIFVTSLFGVVILVFLVCLLAFDIPAMIPLSVSVFLATVVGASIVLRYQDCRREIQKSIINRDHVVSLENHTKIKYVNIKNAVDYMHDKYHVNSALEMNDNYEKYQDMVRQREKFRIANEDLEYYRKQMDSFLRKLNLYDTRIWYSYAKAIVDKREMVEIKHGLIVRRQKLRSRMEYNMNLIQNTKKEIALLSSGLGDIAPQIEQVLARVEELQYNY